MPPLTSGDREDGDSDVSHENASVKGCLMCDSLYVKANGEFPCWDDVGEDLILRVVEEKPLLAQEETGLFDFSGLVEIRKAFLEGRAPHPDLCSKCAVWGHGKAESLNPKEMRVLHIEPAYLCQLACPQCIVPKLRLELKKPPYYMTLPYYEGLLKQLRRDGVEKIRFVHFEGRGDPLLNKNLGDMVRLTREIYPGTFTKVTSHGNYPFRPWMLESGLDLLRLSVDGAFDDSYAQYRVGGKLQKALKLMRDIRDHRRETESHLRVEWKYILFEWNDSDDELREAARLSDELEVDLRFCLTHTPGKSQRFPTMEALAEVLKDLAPRAAKSITFQLKEGPTDASIRHVVAEQTEALLLSALKSYRAGQPEEGRAHLIKALTYDPGLSAVELQAGGDNPVKEHLDRILATVGSPSTFSALAWLQVQLKEYEIAELLFRGYLRLESDPSDREKVERTLVDLCIGNRIGCALSDAEDIEPAHVHRAERAVLGIDPGFAEHELEGDAELVKSLLPQILDRCRYPSTLLALAHLRSLVGDSSGLHTLFDHYVKAIPENRRADAFAQLSAMRRARILRPVKRLGTPLYRWARRVAG